MSTVTPVFITQVYIPVLASLSSSPVYRRGHDVREGHVHVEREGSVVLIIGGVTPIRVTRDDSW